MYVGLKQPRGDGKRYVTPARAAAKETNFDAHTDPIIIGVRAGGGEPPVAVAPPVAEYF